MAAGSTATGFVPAPMELGLLEPGMEADDALLYDLIFRPGFSTAGEVSQLAGRGVGMDVVKTEVGELGGRIEILSQPARERLSVSTCR